MGGVTKKILVLSSSRFTLFLPVAVLVDFLPVCYCHIAVCRAFLRSSDQNEDRADCVVKNVEPHHWRLSPVCLMHLRWRRLPFNFLMMSQQMEASVGRIARCWRLVLGRGTLGTWPWSAKDRCTRQTPSSFSTTSWTMRYSHVLRIMVTYTAHSDRTISDIWTNGSCWRQRVFYSFRHRQRYRCPSDHKCGHRHLLLV